MATKKKQVAKKVPKAAGSRKPLRAKAAPKKIAEKTKPMKQVVKPAPSRESSTSDWLKSLAQQADVPQILLIDVASIVPDPDQPRDTFRVAEIDGGERSGTIEELADDIAVNTLIEPIVVRELDDGRYMLTAGERRWRAHLLLVERVEGRARGAKPVDDPHFIKAQVRNDLVGTRLRLVQLSENLQREDLSDLMVARALLKILQDDPGMQKQDLAKALNKSRSYISRVLGMLDPRYAEIVNSGTIVYASILEQLKALPKETQADVIAAAQREGRAVTIEDVRGRKSAGDRPEPPAVEGERAGSNPVAASGFPPGDEVHPREAAEREPIEDLQRRYGSDDGGDLDLRGFDAMNPRAVAIGQTVTVELTLSQLEHLQKRGFSFGSDAPVRVNTSKDELLSAIKALGGSEPTDAGDPTAVLMKFQTVLSRVSR